MSAGLHDELTCCGLASVVSSGNIRNSKIQLADIFVVQTQGNRIQDERVGVREIPRTIRRH